jgi:hypothetical protein
MKNTRVGGEYETVFNGRVTIQRKETSGVTHALLADGSPGLFAGCASALPVGD